MSLLLIKGNYRIINAAPDGDSIKFYPDNPELWRTLGVRTNSSGGGQLRLEGIDTLETHYQPTPATLGILHQPSQFSQGAADELVKFLGFRNVVRGDREKVVSAQPQQTAGFILTRFSDVYGRCVAFAFKGNIAQADGDEIYIDKNLLRNSANHHMLSQGLAYPTYYSKMYPDLRQEMTRAVASARRKGLWPQDKTTAGFLVKDLAALTERNVILPKLFRRVVNYLALNDGDLSLAGFKGYLESRQDRLIILPAGHVTGFDYVVKVTGQRIKMTVPPEQLVFIEK